MLLGLIVWKLEHLIGKYGCGRRTMTAYLSPVLLLIVNRLGLVTIFNYPS